MLQDDGTFRGRHLLDVFHIMNNVRKRLNDKQEMQHFCRLANARNTAEFDYMAKKAIDTINSRDKPVLQRFL